MSRELLGETAALSLSAPPILRLPDELLEAIVAFLPPPATVAFGTTCKQANRITFEPLVWRRHCIETWRYWEPCHEFAERLQLPPVRTKWHQLYGNRKKTDEVALDVFNQMLGIQRLRVASMENVAKHGYDVKDLMLTLRDATPDSAEDVLARRYHANAILGKIHRAIALDKWVRVRERQMVRLEEVLGAYDLFVLAGERGDLSDLDKELDRIAKAIRDRDPDFDERSIRSKAVQVAKFLRSENLVGNPSIEDYHALRNNFISLALFNTEHTSLPLQSVAIYCAVARRLGVNAKPSNYPQHVHAVIEAPHDQTLDGRTKQPTQDAEPEFMHMDPWRSSEEVPQDHLRLRLQQMGALSHQHALHLAAASMLETALRTSRNIMTSVQEAREAQRSPVSRELAYPDLEASWYAMLWSMVILGDSNSAHTKARRRQCLPYLLEHFSSHFPEDLGLVEGLLVPMFNGEREHATLIELVIKAREDDETRKAPAYRGPATAGVRHRIGTSFRHKRYGYEGVIIGWDKSCGAEQRWIEQMGVDTLPRGREQPFYNVMYGKTYYLILCARGITDARARGDDRSIRYVAEENIAVKIETPSAPIMQMAGKYFKRWDAEAGVFVSNVKDEYPDD